MNQFIILLVYAAVFYLEIFAHQGTETIIPLAAPKNPPEHLVPGYTLKGKIPIEYFYVDDTNNGLGSHYKFPQATVENYIIGVNKTFAKFDNLIQRSGETSIPEPIVQRSKKDQWLYFALIKNNYQYAQSIRHGGKVAVIGSTEPWVEAISIYLGASSVTTLEYNELTYSHEKIVTVSGKDFDSFYSCNGTNINSFDAAITISSLDHDGLGRYGDPLNPKGDLLSMQKLADLLKPDGLLFLTVPIGPDVIVFNLHRRYGKIRLAKLFKGWDIVDRSRIHSTSVFVITS